MSFLCYLCHFQSGDYQEKRHFSIPTSHSTQWWGQPSNEAWNSMSWSEFLLKKSGNVRPENWTQIFKKSEKIVFSNSSLNLRREFFLKSVNWPHRNILDYSLTSLDFSGLIRLSSFNIFQIIKSERSLLEIRKELFDYYRLILPDACGPCFKLLPCFPTILWSFIQKHTSFAEFIPLNI